MFSTFQPTPIVFADRPRWHWIFYMLAIFNICAVGISLFVNHRIMRIYIESVAADRVWVEIERETSQLGELAAEINAPGNDAFQSRDVAEESGKLERAHREFSVRAAELDAILARQSTNARTGSIRNDLRQVQAEAIQMVGDARRTLSFLDLDQVSEAAQHMATMDRRLSAINAGLARMRATIGALQHDQFMTQTAAAARFQKAEYLTAGVITLMIVGATSYGVYIARQASLAAQWKDRYRQDLEHRVLERTAELQASDQARAGLLKQLISAHEDERGRIARDLHDGVGQSLTYLFVALRRLEMAESGSKRSEIAALREVAARMLDDVRRTARGLRPSLLDDVGLQPALERLVGEFQSTHALAIEFDSNLPAERRLPAEVETALYRIVQECLTNVAKHSGAQAASVQLRADADGFEAIVRDDGHGFDIDATGEISAPDRTMGLAGIRERAAILGGTTSIDSQPGAGTCVRIRIPIAKSPGDSPSVAIEG